MIIQYEAYPPSRSPTHMPRTIRFYSKGHILGLRLRDANYSDFEDLECDGEKYRLNAVPVHNPYLEVDLHILVGVFHAI